MSSRADKRLFYFSVIKNICPHKKRRYDSPVTGNYDCPLVPRLKTKEGPCRSTGCPIWQKGAEFHDPAVTYCDACGHEITEDQENVGHECDLHKECAHD
jgi:hypothetical protein